MSFIRTETWGGLTCRVVPDPRGDGGPVVVLLHGFGAPGGDLVPLAGAFDVPPGTTFVFPEAPLELPWGYDSRAWWLIDMARLERALSAGDSALPDEIPPGLPPSRDKVVAMLRELESELGATPDRLVLGGFSQGAMLSCDVALRMETPPAGLALMSATLLSATEWAPLAANLAGRRVLLSHGTQDPLLPFRVAERLRDMLVAGGAEVDWVPFRGQHEIPGVVLEGLARLVN